MNLVQELKKEIVSLVKKETGQKVDVSEISKPPKLEMGDFALPLFNLAKKLDKSPQDLAQELATSIQSGWFAQTKAFGPYLNFYLDKSRLAVELLPQVIKKGSKFSSAGYGRGIKVNLEYLSPNTNKPLTVGHLRTRIYGATVARLMRKVGYKVIESCLYNDRGIAICKSMVAYDLFGHGKTPKSENKKPDQFVGEYYVLFGQEASKDPKLEEMAKEYLILWEKGDKEIRKKWQRMNKWVYEGFNQTLEKLHEGDFDEYYFESDYYDKAKKYVINNLGKGVIKQGPDGEIYADLESYNLPNKVILRSDGTSLYFTQDIYLAVLKNKKKIDQAIVITGDEQNLYMKQLFAVLESLEGVVGKYRHLSYGMMRLPEGKIKSREGFGRALADDLIEKLESLARAEVAKRNNDLSSHQLNKIANQLMNGALKFYILNIDPNKLMVFDPQKAMSFTGKTGPYLQYTVVRLNSILNESKMTGHIDFSLLEQELEQELVVKLKDFPETLFNAQQQDNPSILTHYLYELAQLSNSFYHQVPILKAEPGYQQARLGLIQAISKVLADGLEVCGIEVPERM